MKYLEIGGRDGIEASQMHEYVKKILIDENIPFVEGGSGNDVERSIELYQDCLYQEALKLMVLEKFKTTAMLQRKLRIGYLRAVKLVEMLEHNDVVKRPKEMLMWELQGWYATKEAKEYFKKSSEEQLDILFKKFRAGRK